MTFDLGPLEGFEPREPYLPPDVAHVPEIQFSTGASWQAMAAAYAGLWTAMPAHPLCSPL